MCDTPLRELSNPGASGSIFYLTSDDEFIIKTVQHKEGEFLQKLLPGEYNSYFCTPNWLVEDYNVICYRLLYEFKSKPKNFTPKIFWAVLLSM